MIAGDDEDVYDGRREEIHKSVLERDRRIISRHAPELRIGPSFRSFREFSKWNV